MYNIGKVFKVQFKKVDPIWGKLEFVPNPSMKVRVLAQAEVINGLLDLVQRLLKHVGRVGAALQWPVVQGLKRTIKFWF